MRDGGATRLDNLVLICRRHHRAVHEGGMTVEVQEGGDVRFLRPDGRPIPVAPEAPIWAGHALAPTNAHLEAADIRVGPHTATPDWYGEPLDLHWAIRVLHPVRPDVPAGIAPGEAWRKGKPCSTHDMTEPF